jgi:hypothetical protein
LRTSPLSPGSPRKTSFVCVLKETSGGHGSLQKLLRSKNVQYVDDDGWKHIDAEETRRGEMSGKPKEKIADISEMIRIVQKAKQRS